MVACVGHYTPSPRSKIPQNSASLWCAFDSSKDAPPTFLCCPPSQTSPRTLAPSIPTQMFRSSIVHVTPPWLHHHGSMVRHADPRTHSYRHLARQGTHEFRCPVLNRGISMVSVGTVLDHLHPPRSFNRRPVHRGQFGKCTHAMADTLQTRIRSCLISPALLVIVSRPILGHLFLDHGNKGSDGVRRHHTSLHVGQLFTNVG